METRLGSNAAGGVGRPSRWPAVGRQLDRGRQLRGHSRCPAFQSRHGDRADIAKVALRAACLEEKPSPSWTRNSSQGLPRAPRPRVAAVGLALSNRQSATTGSGHRPVPRPAERGRARLDVSGTIIPRRTDMTRSRRVSGQAPICPRAIRSQRATTLQRHETGFRSCHGTLLAWGNHPAKVKRAARAMVRVGQRYRSQCRPGAGAGPNSAKEVPEPECDRPTELSHLLGQIRVTQKKRKEGGTAGGRAGGRRPGGRREAGREPHQGATSPGRQGGHLGAAGP